MPGFDLNLKTEFQVQKLLIFVRLVGFIVVAALLISLWNLDLIDYNPLPILELLTPIFLILLLIWYLLAEKNYLPGNFLYFQIFIEYFLISFGVFYLSGMHKALDLLYFLPVMSSMLVSLGLTIASVIYAAVFYLIFSYLDILYVHSGIIVPDDALFISFFAAVFFLFVFQGYFLIKKVRDQDRVLQKLKDDFLLRTVHDLRAPANIIRLIIEKYNTKELPKTRPETEEDLNMIKSANLQMMNLLKDVLDAMKSGAFKAYKREKVGVRNLADEVIRQMSPMIAEKNLKIELAEGEFFAVADEEKLREVFINIFDNAIKYNKENGTISFSCKAKGRNLEISIRDSGSGISKENLSKIFTPYFRGDASSSTMGTGLGLYIAKELIEGMGGSVGIISDPGKGTEVSINLPKIR